MGAMVRVALMGMGMAMVKAFPRPEPVPEPMPLPLPVPEPLPLPLPVPLATPGPEFRGTVGRCHLSRSSSIRRAASWTMLRHPTRDRVQGAWHRGRCGSP